VNPSDALGQPLLSCQALHCGYPSRKVLEDVTLELRPGSSKVLLGPNGSGKSTLLKTLSKTLAPLGGDIRIDGRPIEELGYSDLAKRVAYVPQEELPPYRFSVRQVVMMGRMPLSPGFFDSPADEAAADEAMVAADCGELAERPITEVSGGERQRVLIARALAQEAPVLLLDEPTSHLDIGHQVAVIRLVRRLRERGHAILAALHDLNLAAQIGEIAILLQNGRIVMEAPTEAVLDSQLLDETYGVRFKRFRDESFGLRVYAEV